MGNRNLDINHVVMFVTGKCNLGCSYCFQEIDGLRNLAPWAQDTTIETIKATVDFLIANSGAERSVGLGFFGGEPTLRPDLLEYACEYGTQAAQAAGKGINFSVTTNMTLMGDRLIELIKRYNIGVLASIDGQPRPDNQRVYKGTQISSAQKAYESLLLLKAQGVTPTLRWTLAPYAGLENLYDDVVHFADLGFRTLAVEFVYEVPWSAEALAKLEAELRRVAQYYTAELRAGRNLYFKPIDDTFQVYTMDERPQNHCGTANKGVGVGPDGTLQPCHRYVSRHDADDWAVGHVSTGFVEERRLAVVDGWSGAEVTVSDGRSCHDCPIQIRCNGGVCLPVNLDVTGSWSQVPSWHCDIQLTCQRVGNDVLGVLYGSRNPLMVRKLEGGGEPQFGGNTEGRAAQTNAG